MIECSLVFPFLSSTKIAETYSFMNLHYCSMLRLTQRRLHLYQMLNTENCWQTFQMLWLSTWKQEKTNGIHNWTAESFLSCFLVQIFHAVSKLQMKTMTSQSYLINLFFHNCWWKVSLLLTCTKFYLLWILMEEAHEQCALRIMRRGNKSMTSYSSSFPLPPL